MILIKFFLTGDLNDRFKTIYEYLKEANEVHKCYSFLELVIRSIYLLVISLHFL